MSDLPEGWTTEKLSRIADRITKGSTPTSYGFKYQTEGVSFVKVENLHRGRIRTSSIKHFISAEANLNQKRSILEAGDILFSIAGTIGETCLVTGDDLPANTNQALAIIRGTSTLFDPNFFRYQLESEIAQDQAEGKKRGGGMLNLSLADIGNLDTLIPPLNEQKRIVEKLEKLLGKVEAAQERLDKMPAILKRFRQSVLAAAFKNSGETKRLDEIFSVQTGGTPSRKESKYWTNGTVPWVKTGEVQNCNILAAEEFITEVGLVGSNAKIFPNDTLLVAMYGEGKTRGQVGWLKIEAATNQACAALVNQEMPLISKQYVYLFLLSQYHIIRAESVGGNQPNLNLSKIKEWRLPFPEIEEQKEIVRRVEDLFKFADQIEERYKKARSYTDKLTQSILAKAFRGELVPHDPNDEPASVLLERIRANGGTRKPN